MVRLLLKWYSFLRKHERTHNINYPAGLKNVRLKQHLAKGTAAHLLQRRLAKKTPASGLLVAKIFTPPFSIVLTLPNASPACCYFTWKKTMTGSMLFIWPTRRFQKARCILHFILPVKSPSAPLKRINRAL